MNKLMDASLLYKARIGSIALLTLIGVFSTGMMAINSFEKIISEKEIEARGLERTIERIINGVDANHHGTLMLCIITLLYAIFNIYVCVKLHKKSVNFRADTRQCVKNIGEYLYKKNGFVFLLYVVLAISIILASTETTVAVIYLTDSAGNDSVKSIISDLNAVHTIDDLKITANKIKDTINMKIKVIMMILRSITIYIIFNIFIYSYFIKYIKRVKNVTAQ